jgi:hypothetical protein
MSQNTQQIDPQVLIKLYDEKNKLTFGQLKDVLMSAYKYCGPNFTRDGFTWTEIRAPLDFDVPAQNKIDAICKWHDKQYDLADKMGGSDGLRFRMLADAQMIKQIEIYQSMGYKFSDEYSEGSNRLFPTESLYAKMASVAFKFKLIFQGITKFNDSNRQFLFGDMSFLPLIRL